MNDDTTLRLLKFHHAMLQDTARVQAYQAAINQLVRPGDIIVDIGTGTGILSYLACQAGAQHVYAIEMGRVIHLARTLAQTNNLTDRITFLPGVSTDITLPQKADLIISETLGSLGPEEGILSWMHDAQKRFLKPTGQIIPRDLTLYLVPLHLPHQWEQLNFWSTNPFGLDYTPVHQLAANCLSRAHFNKTHWLSQPHPLAHFDLTNPHPAPYTRHTQTFIATRSAPLHGFGGWFTSTLADSLILKTGPTAHTPSWTSAYFPLKQPLPVNPGDEITISIGLDIGGSHWQWRVAVGDVVLDHSTLQGQLIDPAGLQRRTLSHQPTLNQSAQILQRTLTLMDGTRTLQTIANQIAHEFPTYYTTPTEALTRIRNLAMAHSQ